MRNTIVAAGIAIVLSALSPVFWAQDVRIWAQERPPVTFKNEVFPIIKKHCLPCHAEDNYNPSGLVLDTYESLMAGGEHGKAVEPGKGTESLLIKKLGPEPPYGKTMPVIKKKKQEAEPKTKFSESEIKVLVEWIDQGAKNN